MLSVRRSRSTPSEPSAGSASRRSRVHAGRAADQRQRFPSRGRSYRGRADVIGFVAMNRARRNQANSFGDRVKAERLRRRGRRSRGASLIVYQPNATPSSGACRRRKPNRALVEEMRSQAPTSDRFLGHLGPLRVVALRSRLVKSELSSAPGRRPELAKTSETRRSVAVTLTSTPSMSMSRTIAV